MQKVFNNLLYPVESSALDEHSITMCIEFANKLNCHLHILVFPQKNLVTRARSIFGSAHERYQSNNVVNSIYASISGRIKPGVGVKISRCDNSLRAFTSYIITEHIDIIYLAGESPVLKKLRQESLLHPSQCAVLTGHLNLDSEHFQSIVIPVGATIPMSRLKIAVSLAQHFSTAIHLVVTDYKKQSAKNKTLEKAFHLLRSNTNVQVICNYFSNGNESDVVEYARSVHAGMVIEPDTYLPEKTFLQKLLPANFFPKPMTIPRIEVR